MNLEDWYFNNKKKKPQKCSQVALENPKTKLRIGWPRYLDINLL